MLFDEREDGHELVMRDRSSFSLFLYFITNSSYSSYYFVQRLLYSGIGKRKSIREKWVSGAAFVHDSPFVWRASNVQCVAIGRCPLLPFPSRPEEIDKRTCIVLVNRIIGKDQYTRNGMLSGQLIVNSLSARGVTCTGEWEDGAGQGV